MVRLIKKESYDYICESVLTDIKEGVQKKNLQFILEESNPLKRLTNIFKALNVMLAVKSKEEGLPVVMISADDIKNLHNASLNGAKVSARMNGLDEPVAEVEWKIDLTRPENNIILKLGNNSVIGRSFDAKKKANVEKSLFFQLNNICSTIIAKAKEEKDAQQQNSKKNK